MRFFLFLLISTGFAADLHEQPVVEVYLPTAVRGGAMDIVFARARQITAKVYSEVGIRVVWRASASHPAGCRKDPLHQKIVVAWGPTAPGGMGDWAIAYSNPYATEGPCVRLLMDRLEPAVRTNPLSTGYLLGYVLAHEIGHVLQGVLRHSETGVMKARWSSTETSNMPKEPLHFTAEDVDFMLDRFGLQRVSRTRLPA